MDIEFDRESYLDHLTQGTDRLAGGGTGLGLGRHTAELLQEALYPMGRGRAAEEETKDERVAHASAESRKAVAWDLGEDELERELLEEEGDGARFEDARSEILRTRRQQPSRRRRRREEAGPSWSGTVRLLSSEDDWEGSCMCRRGLANRSDARNLRELILTMDSAIRLASLLVRSDLLRPPPISRLRVYPSNSGPCPCSVLSPPLWGVFQDWVTRENLGYDLRTHPGELADAEGYVRRVHMNFRSFVVGSELSRRMNTSHAEYFARNVHELEKADSQPHEGRDARQQMQNRRALRAQELAETYAPRRKGGSHPGRRGGGGTADSETDVMLEFETRAIREKARRLGR